MAVLLQRTCNNVNMEDCNGPSYQSIQAVRISIHRTTTPLIAHTGSKLTAQDTLTVLPPTRSASRAQHSLGSKRYAEQGVRVLSLYDSLRLNCSKAQFLRTYYPDIDITAELIWQELQDDARHALSLRRHDPLSGNLLASFATNTRRPSTYVMYPCGEMDTHLGTEVLTNSFTMLTASQLCLDFGSRRTGTIRLAWYRSQYV